MGCFDGPNLALPGSNLLNPRNYARTVRLWGSWGEKAVMMADHLAFSGQNQPSQHTASAPQASLTCPVEGASYKTSRVIPSFYQKVWLDLKKTRQTERIIGVRKHGYYERPDGTLTTEDPYVEKGGE
jgi:hypothetical protein